MDYGRRKPVYENIWRGEGRGQVERILNTVQPQVYSCPDPYRWDPTTHFTFYRFFPSSIQIVV
jgi:hypothetical protein